MRFDAIKSKSIDIARGPQIVTEAANVIEGTIEEAHGVIIEIIAVKRG